MEHEGAEIIRQYDTNSNGWLEENELACLLSGPDLPHSKGVTAAELIEQYDTNCDGKLAEAEFASVWKHLATFDPWQRYVKVNDDDEGAGVSGAKLLRDIHDELLNHRSHLETCTKQRNSIKF